MPRTKCIRTISSAPGTTWFKPAGIPLRTLEELTLHLDEYEAIRLADLHGLYHEDAANQMGISRQTFGRLIAESRRKIADALVNGKAIRIEGGNVTLTTST